MSWFARSSLEIHCSERIIYISPLGRTDGTIRGATVEGHATLTLARPAYIKEVTIRLLATAVIRSKGRESSGTLVDKTGTQSVNSKLPAGKHEYSFTFEIDASSSHSARPSAAHGFISYRLLATASTGSLLGDYTAPELPLFVVTALDGLANRPPALDYYVEETVMGVGSFSLTWRAPQLTQACVFLTDLNIMGPNSRCLLLNASLILTEHIDFRHFDSDGRLEADTVRQSSEIKISRIDKERLAHTTIKLNGRTLAEPQFPLTVEPGQPLRIRHFARMPISNAHLSRMQSFCRYTTPSATESPIRMSHELTFKLNFDCGGKLLQLVVSRPVQVSSCLLTHTNALPPTYTFKDLNHVDVDKTMSKAESIDIYGADWGTQAVEQCACNLSFDECLQEFLRMEPETPVVASRSIKLL